MAQKIRSYQTNYGIYMSVAKSNNPQMSFTLQRQRHFLSKVIATKWVVQLAVLSVNYRMRNLLKFLNKAPNEHAYKI